MLVNIAMYYAGWIACVVGAANGHWVVGSLVGLAIVGLHLALSTEVTTEAKILLAVAVIGYAVDSLQSAAGVLRFSSGQPIEPLAPVWIGVMWLLFGATLRYCFAWLGDTPGLAALLGAIGGPAAFFAGQRLGAVAFHPTAGLSLAVLAVVWALLFPLLLAVSRRLSGGTPGHYRHFG